MPDVHAGMGMPIGGVLPTEDVVIPIAVGTDIGCGMCAVKTNIKKESLRLNTLKGIVSNDDNSYICWVGDLMENAVPNSI